MIGQTLGQGLPNGQPAESGSRTMTVRPLKWQPLVLIALMALMAQACDKKSGSGKPAAAPQKAAPQSAEENADGEESGDAELVPPPDQGGYAPVD